MARSCWYFKYSLTHILKYYFEYDELDAEEFVDTEYRTWISVFEEEFPESDLYYPEPDEYL